MNQTTKVFQHRNIRHLGILFACASISLSAYGSQWFASCESVAQQFPKTHPVLSRGDSCFGNVCREYWRSGQCLMLNRHELIYEDRETGTGFHGLYYVDLDMPNREPQRLTAGVEGIKEYVTPSGSRFSVIQTASMNGGQYSVDIFTLQRRASKKSPFQITKIISVFNNEGCATSEPQSGCGELAYGLSLSDSSDRHFEIKSKEPPAFIAEPGSMKVKNGKVTLEFPVGLPGNGFLMLRYRLQRNPPGFFLENWGGTVNALQKTTSAMANPLRQNGAPPQSAP